MATPPSCSTAVVDAAGGRDRGRCRAQLMAVPDVLQSGQGTATHKIQRNRRITERCCVSATHPQESFNNSTRDFTKRKKGRDKASYEHVAFEKSDQTHLHGVVGPF